MSPELRELGMDRRIGRRDFLNGMALGVVGTYAAMHDTGALAQQPADAAPDRYPPDWVFAVNIRALSKRWDGFNQGAFQTFPPPAVRMHLDCATRTPLPARIRMRRFWKRIAPSAKYQRRAYPFLTKCGPRAEIVSPFHLWIRSRRGGSHREIGLHTPTNAHRRRT